MRVGLTEQGSKFIQYYSTSAGGPVYGHIQDRKYRSIALVK